MSRENVELIRRHHEAFARGDYEGALAVMAEDIVWDTSRLLLEGGVFHGHEGVKKANRAWLGAWESYEFEPTEYRDGGDRVFVAYRHRGRAKGVALEVEGRETYQVWTVRDGLAVRCEHHIDREAALEAAGVASPNVELVRRRFEAWSRREPVRFLREQVAPDVVAHAALLPGESPQAGLPAVRATWRDWQTTWVQGDWSWEELEPFGERVFAHAHQAVAGAVSGTPVINDLYAVYGFRGGRIAEMLFFRDPEEALAAARAPRRPVLMGVINVTPDSFSDGGEFLDAGAAIAHGRRLAADGAALLDIGGESTRPGAEPVSEDEELRRVVPVLEGLADAGPALSIDTSKLGVARAAIEAGALMVNDVAAFRFAPELAGLVADTGVDCCLMHMLGEPRTMQADPRYDDVVSDVKAFLEERLAFAVAEGVPEERVWLDPGIGFGKTVEHNLELLRRLDEIVAIGRPVLIGTSRKTFIGRLTGRPEKERLAGTIATNVLAYERGAACFRVHDVREVADALTVAAATVGAR
jgi:dihydropteroate synthase